MKILIMCGGKGKRLGPLTERIPKPLIELHGRPLLDINLEEYLRQGFREFVFCTGYKGDLIRRAASRWADRAELTFSDAGEDAGILERLWEARDLYGDDVLMTYGDTFAAIDFHRLVAVHRESAHLATIVTAPIENPFGLVEFDAERRVTHFREKPVLKYYIGVAVLKRAIFDFIHPNIVGMPDGEGLVTGFKILLAMGKLGAHYSTGLQVTFNTQEELDQAEEKLLNFYTAREESHAP